MSRKKGTVKLIDLINGAKRPDSSEEKGLYSVGKRERNLKKGAGEKGVLMCSGREKRAVLQIHKRKKVDFLLL